MRPLAALAQKADQAERYVSWVRLAVILVNTTAFLWRAPPGSNETLAWGVIVVANGYAVAVLAVRQLRRAVALGSSYLLSAMDATLIATWLVATGGFGSPFYLLWYLSLAAVGFRYGLRETLFATALYAGAYVGLLAYLGDLVPNLEEAFVRVAYIVLIGILIAFLSRESVSTIEERARAKSAEESAARIRALVDSAPDAILILAPDRTVMVANREAEELFQRPRAALAGKPAGELAPELAHGISTQGRGILEFTVDQVGAGRVPIEATYSPLETPEGRLTTVLLRDVSERKAAHDALAMSEARFRWLSNSSAEGIAVMDGDLVRDTNLALIRMLGSAPEAIIGARLPTTGDDHAVRDAIRKGGSQVLETAIARADGSTFPAEIETAPASGGDKGATLVYVRDVTERRRVEAARLEAARHMQELEHLRGVDKFKTQFINTAAHELLTPLTPIRLHLHRMMKAPDATRDPGSLDVIARNVERLQGMIDHVLDVAKLEANELGIQKDDLDLNAVVRDELDLRRPDFEKGGIRLVAALHAAPLALRGDRGRLRQAVAHLLTNAVKFTPQGGEVRVSTSHEAGCAVVRVRDSGAGIRREDIPRLFQRFGQVHDTMQQTAAGSGLGLYIVKGIVDLHGGTSRAESPGPGQGSTFTLMIPCIAGDTDAQGSSATLLERARQVI